MLLATTAITVNQENTSFVPTDHRIEWKGESTHCTGISI